MSVHVCVCVSAKDKDTESCGEKLWWRRPSGAARGLSQRLVERPTTTDHGSAVVLVCDAMGICAMRKAEVR